jgi:hypothetical protein
MKAGMKSLYSISTPEESQYPEHYQASIDLEAPLEGKISDAAPVSQATQRGPPDLSGESARRHI